MTIRSFKQRDLEAFFFRGARSRKKGWDSAHSVVRRKLDMLNYAKELSDLLSPPNNRLERLKGDFKGLYSIRINDQWRMVFGWKNGPYDVRVIDYH